ncbi:DUF5327 family protein, partial [Bacillus sp. JJ722]|uniref:DUF5327 family protein n=1 Tax=Bacillus sp. JJ722 TaxID=3122973 RepID=UPI002FFEF722
IQRAKTASTFEKKQSYILAIKALCEIMSEEEGNMQVRAQPVQEPQYMNTPTAKVTNQKPLPMNDANGSSLLDF